MTPTYKKFGGRKYFYTNYNELLFSTLTCNFLNYEATLF